MCANMQLERAASAAEVASAAGVWLSGPIAGDASREALRGRALELEKASKASGRKKNGKYVQ